MEQTPASRTIGRPNDVAGQGPTGPLAGIRILDITTVVMGPYATQLLGDMGADVVKVEDSGGDLSRAMGAGRHRELSGTALNLHRNKRSVTLDLKAPELRPTIEALVRHSDVVITNLRPGPLERLRLNESACRNLRPDLIFCQAQGWPTDSAEADRPAYDDIIQSATGVPDVMQRTTRQVALYPTIAADKICGQIILSGVLAALFHRQRTGEGQRVEVPMIDAMLSFQLVEHLAGATYVPPLTEPGYARVVTAERGPKRALDGWITILPYDDRHWREMFRAGGRPELAEDPRFADARARAQHPEELYATLGDLICTRTVSEWVEVCGTLGIAAEPVRSLNDAIAAAETRGFITHAEHPTVGTYRRIGPPVRLSRTPLNVWREAPLVGQHTNSVLAELGISDPDQSSPGDR